jgi:predicted SprT family Zn-dependent metalloprotease
MNKTKHIEEFLNSIQWLFQIQNYDRKIVVKGKSKNAAEIWFDEKYQTIEITLYNYFFEQSLESQRKILLHELCHTITIPQKDASYKMGDGKLVTKREIDFLNEKETSIIENILDSLLQGKMKYAVEAYNNYGKTQRIRSNKRNKKDGKATKKK